MGILDFFTNLFRKKEPQKVYGPTEVTKVLKATLPLWNDLINKYPQNPQKIYEQSSSEAGRLAGKLRVGIDALLGGLANAKRKGREINPEELAALRSRLKVFQATERSLNNVIAAGKIKPRR